MKQLDHLTAVRCKLAAAGFAAPGQNVAQLTGAEMREQSLGYAAGVSADDVATVFIARRIDHLTTAVADGYVVESDENGHPRVLCSEAA
jgi:hypothetical protein